MLRIRQSIRPVPFLPPRLLLRVAWVAALLFPGAVLPLQAQEVDIEARGGPAFVCGACTQRAFTWDPAPAGQIFADILFHLDPVERLSLGPYGKVAGLYDTVLVAGGLAFGVTAGSLQLLLNAGLAYSADRIGEQRTVTGARHPGQSQGTYDLGASLRWFLSDSREGWYALLHYGHNSNGEGLGINWFSNSAANPGIESIMAGIGYRF